VGRGGWLKTSYGGKGLAENVRKPSYMGGGSKIAQKNRHMIFERSLNINFYLNMKQLIYNKIMFQKIREHIPSSF